MELSGKHEFLRFKYSLLPPTTLVVLIWLVKLIEIVNQTSFYRLGVFPREVKGLPGIALAIFIHSDINHLISNSIPLLILFTGLLYFYRDLSYRVLLFIWLTGGAMVWLGARESYHIGASGLIYGMASFLFFSGIIRQDIRLMAISLLVVFLYGGLIWGIFPIFPGISWEYHFFGGVCGLMAAALFRRQGPQRPVWTWELDGDTEPEESEKMAHPDK